MEMAVPVPKMPIRGSSASPNSEPGRGSPGWRDGACPVLLAPYQARGKPHLHGNQTPLSGLGTENRSPPLHSHHAHLWTAFPD